MEKLSVVSGYSDVTDSKTIGPMAVGRLAKCSHTFHLLCLLAMYCNGNKDGSLQCPSCKTIYGEKTGTQPRGKMEVFTFQMSLPGHEDCGTILIVYNIPHGIQVRGTAQEEPPWIFLESASEALPVPLCPPGSLKVSACPVRLPAIRRHSCWGLQPALRVVEAKRWPLPFLEPERASWRWRHLSWTSARQKAHRSLSRRNKHFCSASWLAGEPASRNPPKGQSAGPRAACSEA
nr:uncharacterized protein LOC110126211 isoform X2 [Odocoileus virginianus texanus]